MKTIELGHAVLYVRDLERSRHFYGEVLGLPEIGPAFPGAAAFSGGRTHHELLLIEVGPSAASPPAGPAHRPLPPRASRSAPPTTSCATRPRRSRTPGVTIVGASDHTVTHSLYVQDPDGNELELYIDVQPERVARRPRAGDGAHQAAARSERLSRGQVVLEAGDGEALLPCTPRTPSAGRRAGRCGSASARCRPA